MRAGKANSPIKGLGLLRISQGDAWNDSMNDWLACWCGCHAVLFLSYLENKSELLHVLRAKNSIRIKTVCLLALELENANRQACSLTHHSNQCGVCPLAEDALSHATVDLAEAATSWVIAGEALGLFAQCFLQSRSDSIDCTVPIHRLRSITPSRVWSIQGDFIPVESFPYTAFRLQLP